MHQRGWASTEVEAATHQLARLLLTREEGAEAGTLISVEDAALTLGVAEEVADHAASLLDQASMLITARTLDGSVSFCLSQEGRGEAANLRGLSQVVEFRRAACRDALLNWLYERETAVPLSLFASNYRAYVYGYPITSQEIERAAQYLRGADLVEASEHDQGIAALGINHAGTVCVEQYHSSVAEYERSRPPTARHGPLAEINIHGNSGNVSLANHSPGATLTATANEPRASIEADATARGIRAWVSKHLAAVIVALVSGGSAITVAVIEAHKATGK